MLWGIIFKRQVKEVRVGLLERRESKHSILEGIQSPKTDVCLGRVKTAGRPVWLESKEEVKKQK